MKTTINVYELLGLIKDCKAPKKIKWQDRTYFYAYKHTIKEDYDYQNDNRDYLLSQMTDHMYLSSILDEEVEILEEDKPTVESMSISGKDIHKLENLGIYNIIEDIEVKLNEVIDYINGKEDK